MTACWAACCIVDRFGNVITYVRGADVPNGDVVIELGGRTVRGLVGTYAGAIGLAAIVGSGGYIEIGLPGASAAAELSVALGDQVVLRPGG